MSHNSRNIGHCNWCVHCTFTHSQSQGYTKLKKHFQGCHRDKKAQAIDNNIAALKKIGSRLRNECLNAMHAKYQAIVSQLGYAFPKSNSLFYSILYIVQVCKCIALNCQSMALNWQIWNSTVKVWHSTVKYGTQLSLCLIKIKHIM